MGPFKRRRYLADWLGSNESNGPQQRKSVRLLRNLARKKLANVEVVKINGVRYACGSWRPSVSSSSLLVNFPSEAYNREEPDEQRLPWDTDQIPFNWEVEFK